MVSNWFMNRAKDKRSRALALALGLCLFTGAAMVTPMGSSAVTAMQQAADELEDYLNRSPGERGAVLAGKGKGGKGAALASASAPDGPSEEALGKVFDMPTSDPVEEIAGTQAPPAEEGLPLAVAPTVLAPGGLIPGGGGGGFPGGGGIPGGGGPGGGGPGGGGGGGGGGGPPPVGAVPEPSTWALLIMGFMFTGGMMRRANRAARTPVHA